jgi:hypothetical protein
MAQSKLPARQPEQRAPRRVFFDMSICDLRRAIYDLRDRGRVRCAHGERLPALGSRVKNQTCKICEKANEFAKIRVNQTKSNHIKNQHSRARIHTKAGMGLQKRLNPYPPF